MGRGFGGGSFSGGGSSSGGYSSGSSSSWGHGHDNRRYNGHGGFGAFSLIAFFLFGGFGAIMIISILWSSFASTLSTKWRTPLVHSNEAMNISEIQLNNTENAQESLEYLYEKTGVVGRIITIKGTFYSNNDPNDYYTNIQEDLYYDGGSTFYLYNSPLGDIGSNFAANYATSKILEDIDLPPLDSVPKYNSYNMAKSLSENELEQMCESIYDSLYDDEYHMLIINLSDFSEWGFAYYTGTEADKVFDKQAGNIFVSLATKENSFNNIPEVLEKTTDIIMEPPIKFYILIVLAIVILGVVVRLIFKNSKKIKASMKRKKSELSSEAKDALQKVDDFTIGEFKE